MNEERDSTIPKVYQSNIVNYYKAELFEDTDSTFTYRKQEKQVDALLLLKVGAQLTPL